MKVAIIHEWFSGEGGSEKVVKLLHEIYPDAPIYVFIHNKKKMPKEYNDMDVRTSFIQKIPFGIKKYQNFLPLMPLAVEQYDLSEFDLVLSSSTCCAKGVITKVDTVHICYCHTPMRYGWDLYHEYVKDKSLILKMFMAMSMKKIRMWDRLSADRVDYFLANSGFVSKRIEKTYKRKSNIIYPPVNTEYYTPNDESEIGDYYLIVSRLVVYKRIDLAVKAFNELGLQLVIIGEGPEMKKCKEIANKNIKFAGRLSDGQVREYYRSCKGFIFPGEEDFGITPVEVQASGRPVIAFGKGGALETIIDNVTGSFFYEQTTEALIKCIKEFEKKIKEYNSVEIRKHAEKFSEDRFKNEIKDFVNEIMGEL